MKLSKELKIIIIGGPDNWINKLNLQFPSIVAYSCSNHITVDKIARYEYIFISTEYISHSLYYKVVDNLTVNQKLGYINNTNIELVSKQIVEYLNQLK